MIRYDIQKGVQKIKTKTFITISGLGLVLGGGAMSMAILGSAHAANTTTTINPSNFSSVFSKTDNRADSSNNFVFGPASPPVGSGSLELTTGDSPGKQQAFENQQAGTAISAVNSMAYSTYRHSDSTGSAVQLPAINMEIYTNTSGANTGYTTLVFEPVYNTTQGAVANDTWQNWNAYSGGSAVWWSSHDLVDPSNPSQFIACNPNGDNASTAACAGKLFVPFSSIVSAFPSATVIDYGYNQGTGNPGIHANIDALSIGSSGNLSVYDFEPAKATVTIAKNLNGAPATATSANNTAFPMESTWSATNIGSGTGNYSLGPVGYNNPNPYQATTSEMTLGSTYTTHELTGSTVTTSCVVGGAPYVLRGYTTGDSLSIAEAATPTMTVPNFTNLQQDEYVVVWNSTCHIVAAPKITHPTNGATLTTAQWDKVDWNNVTGATSYEYQSFTNATYTGLPAYDSGFTLTNSEIPTPGTPPGNYYLQVRAQDADGNISPWSDDAAHPYVVHVVAATTPPTTKDDCRNGGWKTFNSPSYKNQDKCIDYVVAHGHNTWGDVHYTANGLKREADFSVNTYNSNKGNFEYWDNNGGHYKVKVSVVKVSGHNAWFAGVVTKASDHSNVGKWLFAEVQDGSPDKIWGSFTTKATATTGVNSMNTPADGAFPVTKGNLKVN